MCEVSVFRRAHLLQDSWISDRPERGMRPGQKERCNTRALGDMDDVFQVVGGLARIQGISLVSSGDPIIHMWITGAPPDFANISTFTAQQSYSLAFGTLLS